MPKITKYKQNTKGLYDVVVKNVEIPEKAINLLNLNHSIDVDCSVIDPSAITSKQRKKIFAMCRDIELYWGEPVESSRHLFQRQIEIVNGYEPISLSNCSKKVASELIELIIAFMFHHQIPMTVETSKLLKSDKALLYWATVNRNCVICGKPKSDLAHLETVGRGMNRNKMNHYDKHVLALCRKHHTEQHNIGVDSFNEKYHLAHSWIEVDEKLNKMLRGEKNES